MPKLEMDGHSDQRTANHTTESEIYSRERSLEKLDDLLYDIKRKRAAESTRR